MPNYWTRMTGEDSKDLWVRRGKIVAGTAGIIAFGLPLLIVGGSAWLVNRGAMGLGWLAETADEASESYTRFAESVLVRGNGAPRALTAFCERTTTRILAWAKAANERATIKSLSTNYGKPPAGYRPSTAIDPYPPRIDSDDIDANHPWRRPGSLAEASEGFRFPNRPCGPGMGGRRPDGTAFGQRAGSTADILPSC